MTKFEWVQRARMHFAKRTQHYNHDWEDIAETTYEEMHDYFPEEPEDAADETIGCWD